MPSSSVRGLLIALVACVQLVLAPALRPKACGSALPGGHACCGQPAESELESDCCCGDTPGVPAPGVPSPCDPGSPGDRPADGDPCRCHHAPDPWIPADDPAPTSVDSGARLLAPSMLARLVSPPREAAPFEARAGPPGRPGPALHLRHCVFLI